uniref:Glycylpeptide N-tetradecanoyltransferase n=1 Tax=Alexandrium catenella TaxID=2925 RepID=A0A7S1KYW2_ALECA
MARSRLRVLMAAAAVAAVAALGSATAGSAWLWGCGFDALSQLRPHRRAVAGQRPVSGTAARGSHWRLTRSAAGVLDKPPPPADLDEGDGEEEYEVRFLSNEEREYHAQLWLPMAGEEDRRLLETAVLPFRSTQFFTGKSRLCIGAFVGEKCEGLATSEVVMDYSDISAFFTQRRCLRCLSLVTKPRVRTEAGSIIVRAVKQFAEENGYRADFEPIQELSGGKYWVLARSL